MEDRRMVSLDVLRGLTVALMVLVNNAGDGAVSYRELRHSTWNGCTLADVVFPLFLFIVGASIAIALPRRLASGASRTSILWQAAQRSFWIAAIGLLLNALPSLRLADLRYFGVLQRIAVCYLLASCVFLFGRWRGCVLVFLLAVFGYWMLLRFVPVPGFGVPSVDVPLLDPHGNLAAWLDRALVPAAHLYRHSFYDPEGLLSCVPAVATTLAGTLSVLWLRSPGGRRSKTIALLACGALMVDAGLLWGHTFPLNKRLWTSSFAIFNAGLDMVLLALLHSALDGAKALDRWLQRCLMPWLAFGSNALTAYVFSEVLAIVLGAVPLGPHTTLQQALFHLIPAVAGTPALCSLLYSVLFVGVCFLPIAVLYRKRIFLKL